MEEHTAPDPPWVGPLYYVVPLWEGLYLSLQNVQFCVAIGGPFSQILLDNNIWQTFAWFASPEGAPLHMCTHHLLTDDSTQSFYWWVDW